MDQTETKAGTLTLMGGRLSLDFANTADWHASEQPVEFLTSYDELVAWGLHVGTLTNPQAQRMLDRAAVRPLEAMAALHEAINLREVIYRLFSAIAQGNVPAADDLEAFNVELALVLARSQIVPTAEGYAWDWTGDEDALDRMLWPVVRDAADLLTSGELSRVGRCADERCGWLFVDTSRNHSRRWCSMEACGNRAKARRHYHKSRD